VSIRFAAALLAALALALAPSTALAGWARHATATRTRDALATRTYLRANYALVRAARANLAAGEAALRGLVRQITGECPRAAARSPQNHDSEQLSDEIVGTMTLLVYHPDAGAMTAFAHAVRGLRWSNHALTRAVRTYAAQLRGLTTLALPNVCADVRAWAAGGYGALPASTVQFDQSYEADDIEAEQVHLRLFAAYESRHEASLVRRTRRLEAPLAQAEANAVEEYTQILDALGLNQ
jgi:hypothetical protein